MWILQKDGFRGMAAGLTNILLLMLTLSTGSCQGHAPLTLIKEGHSTYVLILPDKPVPHERKAAEVLRQYLQRMTGAVLSVIAESAYNGKTGIFIGRTQHAPGRLAGRLQYDGFFIATDDADVYIRGASGKGVLYGAYTFLEQYAGCRKYAGGEPAAVPRTKNLTIPSNIADVQNPRFVYRQSYYPASDDPEYLDWHKLQRFEDLWGLWGHSFFKIIPPEKYFSAHPEYFSLVQGRRQPMQLCLSSEAVLQLTIDYLRKAIQAKPDAIYWSLSPNDDGGYCTCDRCRQADAEEGGPQGSLIRFVNRVAAAFPEQRFTTLAYTYTAQPPRKTRPAPNVYVFLSSIDAYRTRPLSSEPSAAGFRKDLEGWAALTDRLFIWDYTTQFTNYLTPFPDYMHAAGNLRFFADKRVSGVFLHGSEHSYSDMAELNSYLHAKLLWNPEADAQAVREDFLKGYYGAAGKHIVQYIDTLQQTVAATGARLDIYGNPVNNDRDYLSPENIDWYSSLLDKAEAAAEGHPDLEARVGRARLPLEYVVLQQSVFFGAQHHGYITEDDAGSYSVRPHWPERVQRFSAQCATAGVTELSEGGMSPQGYLQEWKERFTRLPKHNLAADATVTLAHPYSPDYPAHGEQTLTDGLPAGKDYSAGWLLFYGSDMIATLDLHAARKVRTVMAGFLSDPRHYIFLPLRVQVEVSEDGAQYRSAGVQELQPVQEDFSVAVRQYAFTVPAGAAVRYIRVTAVCPATLPDWRFHAQKKPAVACDEVMVE